MLITTLLIYCLFGCSQKSLYLEEYLGQDTPGISAKKFIIPTLPGFFVAERIAISTKGDEIFYSEFTGGNDAWSSSSNFTIKCYKYSNNKWEDPIVLFNGFHSPALSIDDSTLYMETVEKINNENVQTSWFSKRNNSGWGNPVRFSIKPIYQHYLQITNSGNIYLSSKNAVGGLGKTDWSRLFINKSDTLVKSLGQPLNNENDNNDFYIAKDESYIIFVKNSKFWISFNEKGNSWTTPKCLFEEITGWGVFVSSDNKYLFFTSATSASDCGIYWVSIESLIGKR